MRVLFFADHQDRQGDKPLLSLCSDLWPLSPKHPAVRESGAETNIPATIRTRVIQIEGEHARPSTIAKIAAAQRKYRLVPQGFLLFMCNGSRRAAPGYWRLP